MQVDRVILYAWKSQPKQKKDENKAVNIGEVDNLPVEVFISLCLI